MIIAGIKFLNTMPRNLKFVLKIKKEKPKLERNDSN